MIFDEIVFPFADNGVVYTIPFQHSDVLLPLHLTSQNNIPSTVSDHVPDFVTSLPSTSVTNPAGDDDTTEPTVITPESAPVAQEHGMCTRLQHGIHKPK